MKKNWKWTKIGNTLLLIVFSLVIIDRIFVYLEMRHLLYYIGYVIGQFTGFLANLFT